MAHYRDPTPDLAVARARSQTIQLVNIHTRIACMQNICLRLSHVLHGHSAPLVNIHCPGHVQNLWPSQLLATHLLPKTLQAVALLPQEAILRAIACAKPFLGLDSTIVHTTQCQQ